MDGLIIFGTKYLVYVIVLVAVVHVLLNKERRAELGVVALLALALGYALARLAGFLFSHHQPFAEQGFEPLVPHAIDNSFPSDHTLISGVFASVAFLADRRVGLALWALTLLVGLSRMLAGLHYSVDIFAAAVLAVAAVWVAGKALR
jgi:undecaprenyl-diphosphatase